MAFPISATVLTKNSERRLRRCLQSLANCDEIIVVDSGSSDRTEVICKEFPQVRFVHHPFRGFGEQHNHAALLCKNDWILSIDSDEELSGELPSHLDPNAAYRFRRKNFYRGQWIRGCGWWPDKVVRLFHRKNARFSDDAVHEKVLSSQIIDCDALLLHEPYTCIADFLEKMQRYTDLFRTAKKISLGTAICHAIGAFCKSYLLKGGFMDGRAGFIISAYNGHTAFYKYLKALEKRD